MGGPGLALQRRGVRPVWEGPRLRREGVQSRPGLDWAVQPDPLRGEPGRDAQGYGAKLLGVSSASGCVLAIRAPETTPQWAHPDSSQGPRCLSGPRTPTGASPRVAVRTTSCQGRAAAPALGNGGAELGIDPFCKVPRHGSPETSCAERRKEAAPLPMCRNLTSLWDTSVPAKSALCLFSRPTCRRKLGEVLEATLWRRLTAQGGGTDSGLPPREARALRLLRPTLDTSPASTAAQQPWEGDSPGGPLRPTEPGFSGEEARRGEAQASPVRWPLGPLLRELHRGPTQPSSPWLILGLLGRPAEQPICWAWAGAGLLAVPRHCRPDKIEDSWSLWLIVIMFLPGVLCFLIRSDRVIVRSPRLTWEKAWLS